MVKFFFANTVKEKVSKKLFLDTLKRAEEVLNFDRDKSLELVLISDQEIRKLNKVYRGKDKATDVISFSFKEAEIFPNEKSLGEIYISVETAKKQAKDLNHSFEYELRFLFIHGLLHVFGYDHRTDEEERRMNEVAE